MIKKLILPLALTQMIGCAYSEPESITGSAIKKIPPPNYTEYKKGKVIEELLRGTASHNLPVYKQPNMIDEDKNSEDYKIIKYYKNLDKKIIDTNKINDEINLNKQIKYIYDFKENKDIFGLTD